MKLLLSEEWHKHIYAEPFLQRFRELGAAAYPFKEARYFGGDSGARSLWARAQRRLAWGPAFARLNADLLAETKRLRPEAVFLFRGNNVLPDTVRALRELGVHVVGWNNDDPFSAKASPRRWKHFVDGIPLYDRLWGYRAANVEEYRRRGCPRVGLLRSFYLRELNYPMEDVSRSPYRAQVSFIGHWEDDGRDDFVEGLLREPGLDFKLWERSGSDRACVASSRAASAPSGLCAKRTTTSTSTGRESRWPSCRSSTTTPTRDAPLKYPLRVP
jgi:hypothetical protein